MEPAPIACSLDSGGLAERQRRWDALADRAAVELSRTQDGLRLRFRRDPGVEIELRELAALERQCCSFADWSVHADGDAAVIDIRGSSTESVAAVHEMFAALRRA
jgi:hypothetical protein